MQSLVPIQLADHISPFQRGLDGHRGRESETLWRSDKRRTRDQETKRDRDRKYSDDEDDDADLRDEAEGPRKAAEERARGRELIERERAYYSQLEDDVLAYQGRDKRPSLSRSASTTTKTETYVDLFSSRPTPVFVRRHSNKPAAPSFQPRRDRDWKMKMSVPDILESDERRPTTLYASASSPSSNKLLRGVERGPPLRSASMKVDSDTIRVLPSPTTSRHSASQQVYPIRSNLVYDDSYTRPSAARDTRRISSVSAISNHNANLNFRQYSNANRDTVLQGFPSLTKEANRYLNDTISADHTGGHGEVTKMKLCALSTRL